MKLNIQDKGKSGIYLIRNLINGKVYIGKAKDIYKRIKDHITSLNTKNLKRENEHFINSWHKYNKENFSYCVLQYQPIENLAKLEIFYIDKYESLNPKKGYNKRYDSSTGLIVSQETRNKASISQKKRFENIEERNKIGKKTKEFWANNSDILKEMSKKVAAKNRTYYIGQYDMNLNLIKVFTSKFELLEQYPEFYYQAIMGCCQGNKNSYKGFKWKYINKSDYDIV